MKNRKYLIIILALAIVAAAATIVLVVNSGDKEPETTATPKQSQTSESTSQHTALSTQPTSGSTTEPASKEDSTKKQIKMLQGKYWYLFDNNELTCYAFCFNENGEADVAYFSSANINGEDAQYSKGFASYRIDGKNIKLYDMPNSFPIKEFSLSIDSEDLKQGDNICESYDELTLNHALAHFV